MRILFACWPFEGHVFPQMAIATKLRERGHDVAFYTGPRLQPVVEAEGFHVFPFRRVPQTSWERVHSAEQRTDGKRQSLRVEHQAFRDWLVETIPGQVTDLQEVIAEWRPDVLASDVSMWGPSLILNDLGPMPVALAPTILGPLIPGPDAPAWGFGLRPPRNATGRVLRTLLNRGTDLVAAGLRRRINEIRAEYGLSPLQVSVNAAMGRLPLFLVGNVTEMDYRRTDLPASVNYVGACIWHPPEPPGTAAWLDAIPSDRPWVHVTEGTSHHSADPFVLRAGVQGLAGRKLEALITTGRSRNPASLSLGPVASNVHVTDWLSHSELLPRCDAIVTTGGAATIMAALSAGVPIVIVPTTWDKPDNARRITEAGVGVRLSSKKCTPDGLRDAVEEILGNPRYQRNARNIAHSLSLAPGPAGAADLLLDLAERGERRDISINEQKSPSTEPTERQRESMEMTQQGGNSQ
jgi:MGT family glycosyltransferase